MGLNFVCFISGIMLNAGALHRGFTVAIIRPHALSINPRSSMWHSFMLWATNTLLYAPGRLSSLRCLSRLAHGNFCPPPTHTHSFNIRDLPGWSVQEHFWLIHLHLQKGVQVGWSFHVMRWHQRVSIKPRWNQRPKSWSRRARCLWNFFWKLTIRNCSVVWNNTYFTQCIGIYWVINKKYDGFLGPMRLFQNNRFKQKP